jgi:hypothetical protein
MIYIVNAGHVKDETRKREGGWNICCDSVSPKDKIISGAF